MNSKPKQILFGGYAPVHFLCFQPIYERLRQDPDVEVWLTGGLRREDERVKWFDAPGLYDGLSAAPEHVVPFEQAYEREYDVAICSHTSDSLLPRKAGQTVQIFHGVSFKNFAVRDKVLQYDVVCLPGPYHANRFRQEGLLEGSQSTFLLSGFAKADRFVEAGFDRDGFLSERGLDPARPTVLFAPTGGKHNSLETIGEQVIEALATDGRWNLMIKPHDHPKREIDWFSRLAPLEGERVRLIRDLDVVDPLRAADLLLSDASSVAVEYTLLDRPMVFIDVPKLLKNVLKRGAPLDLETHGRKIGRLARTPEEVIAEIERGLAEPNAQSEVRRQTAAHVFSAPGKAAERVAEIVRWAAGLRAAPPADIEVLST